MLRRTFLLGVFCVACADPLAMVTLGPETGPIYYGTRDPQNITLSAGQMLAIGYLAYGNGDNFCTGTLTSPTVVLTARHCVEGLEPADIRFGIGLLPSEPDHLLLLAGLREHPSMDIAILILQEDVTSKEPDLLPLPMNRVALSADWIGRWVDASGYGQTHDDSEGRYFASVEVTSYLSETVEVNGHGINGICFGDSGGPILWQDAGGESPVVVGTEMVGDESCVDYDTLARVDRAADWVDETVGGLLPCGEIDFVGVCEGEVIHWCDDGFLSSVDCATEGVTCGYMGPALGNYCVPPICEGIDWHGTCEGNTLEWCQPTQDGAVLRERDCTQDSSECIWIDADTGYNCGSCIECHGICTDLSSSMLHCGECDSPCAPAHATGACVDGVCLLGACAAGYRDQDRDPANGCETRIERDSKEDEGCDCATQPGGALAAVLVAVVRRGRRRQPKR